MVGSIHATMPKVRITLRGDGHYACPEVMAWCEAQGHRLIFGLPGTETDHKHVRVYTGSPPALPFRIAPKSRLEIKTLSTPYLFWHHPHARADATQQASRTVSAYGLPVPSSLSRACERMHGRLSSGPALDALTLERLRSPETPD